MIAKPVATAGTCGSTNASAPAPSVESSSGHRRLSTVRPGLISGRVGRIRALDRRFAIGGEVSPRRPSQTPITAAIAHQPAPSGTTRPSPLSAAPATVTAASALAAAALIRTVVRRKSEKRTLLRDQGREQVADAVGPLDGDVSLLHDLRGPLLGGHADANGGLKPAVARHLHQAAERVEIGGVVADIERDVDVRVLEQRRDPGALVDLHGWAHLEHLAAPVSAQPGVLGAGGDRIDGGTRSLLIGRAAPVEGDDRALVLDPHATAAQVGGVGLAAELVDAPRPVLEVGIEDRLGPAGAQQLGSVRADVGDGADRDHRAGLGGAA